MAAMTRSQRPEGLIFPPLSVKGPRIRGEGTPFRPGYCFEAMARRRSRRLGRRDREMHDDSRRGVAIRAASAIGQKKECDSMALYEHVFLARQDLAQAQVDALADTATQII